MHPLLLSPPAPTQNKCMGLALTKRFVRLHCVTEIRQHIAVTKFNVCVLGATLCDTPENEDLPSGYESDGISSCSEEAEEH